MTMTQREAAFGKSNVRREGRCRNTILCSLTGSIHVSVIDSSWCLSLQFLDCIDFGPQKQAANEIIIVHQVSAKKVA